MTVSTHMPHPSTSLDSANASPVGGVLEFSGNARDRQFELPATFDMLPRSLPDDLIGDELMFRDDELFIGDLPEHLIAPRNPQTLAIEWLPPQADLARPSTESLIATLNGLIDKLMLTDELLRRLVANVECSGELRQGELRELLGASSSLLGESGLQPSQLAKIRTQLARIDDSHRWLTAELARVAQMSLTDELTGLPNRRAFLQSLDQEIDRCRNEHAPLTIALIDIDDFKEINDRYGHPAGDQVLKLYAAEIIETVGSLGLAARFGGEEFILLLPNADLPLAYQVLSRLRRHRHVAEQRLIDQGLLRMPTFSGGITRYKANESPTALIERADQAMYRAKRRGKDRLSILSPIGGRFG